MRKVELLAQDIKDLNPTDLAEFRQWFHDFDAEEWDRQIQEDALSGKLEDLARQALAEHAAGRIRIM